MTRTKLSVSFINLSFNFQIKGENRNVSSSNGHMAISTHLIIFIENHHALLHVTFVHTMYQIFQKFRTIEEHFWLS